MGRSGTRETVPRKTADGHDGTGRPIAKSIRPARLAFEFKPLVAHAEEVGVTKAVDGQDLITRLSGIGGCSPYGAPDQRNRAAISAIFAHHIWGWLRH